MIHKCLTVVIFLLSALVKGQSLQSFLDLARENNPQLKALELRYEIASEKVNEANWLPNTEFGAGYFISEPETRTGAQRARFSIRQMLPWFGTSAQRAKLAESMAETDYIEYSVARRRLESDVAQSYYQLFGLQAKRSVIAENIELLKTYEELALTSVEVGRASVVDVLRLQIRQKELLQQKERLREQFEAERAVLNALLNRDIQTKVNALVELSIPESDIIVGDSLQVNPELVRFDKMYEAVTQAELLNQKEGGPMWGVSLDYFPVEKRPDMTFDDNGKDIIMPMVSLSLPLFNRRYNSRTQQNELRKQEIEFQKQERLNMLNSAYAQAVSKRREARITFDTQSENLSQAKEVEQILLTSYETGTVDFEDLLDIQELQLTFRINQIESVEMYYQQSAIINYLRN